MFSQIATVRTAFPSAFSALGVGSLAIIGMLPASILFNTQFGGTNLFDFASKSSLLRDAIPFLLGAGAFFYTYAMGMAFIAMGSRIRGETLLNDVARMHSVLESKNELFVKYFFEQKATIELFDGLVVGFGFTIAMNSIPLVLIKGEYIYGPCVLIIGLGIGYMMFRESRRRIQHLELLLAFHKSSNGEMPLNEPSIRP